MGAEEETTPSNPSKVTTSTQETPKASTYPDWSTSMQAYHAAGAIPPFYASTVASPTPHPYIWGGQHPYIPPYGTPVPYPAMYSVGGVYAHTNMTPNALQNNTEMEGKPADVKDQSSTKLFSKGNSGLDSGKCEENGKATSGSGSDGASDGAESWSEGSLNASDENNNQQDIASSKKERFNQMLADGASAKNIQASVPVKPVVSMPGTNLNIGMDIWDASPAAAVKSSPNTSISSAVVPVLVDGREGLMPDHPWIQDEREIKRQKRKLSNRESARRSRLRKQAECDELQRRVETLNNENRSLRDELQRLSEECEKLTSENNSIKEELNQLYGADAIANPGDKNLNSGIPPIGGEDDG
ncbi:hypothetical protein Nepgr_008315 [Nepenthes gracilis]|uniref:BZIP domain-containing protein n=1 Tax=Nepenthes gracilis TaxID=150966 RepID=A0AAD3S8T5_NEPGR|nr:hypothetical protein Nepgr_008315 [Nepenthes gracilis]